MEFSSKQHIKSLDGLRGIAILLVFTFHYIPRDLHNPLEYVAALGWSGVDLFFVLSGFLITGILYDTRSSTRFFGAFYARRALRLLPVYCLAVAVVVVGTDFFRGDRTWLNIPFFFYGSNIVPLFKSGSTTFPPYFTCTHFWSLALEEQFYSIWPLVVFFVARRSTLIRICIGGITTAILFRIGLAAMGASTWIAFAELPTRMDSLLLGALLALGVRGPDRETWLNPKLLRWMLGSACLALAVVIVKAGSLSFISIPMSTLGYTAIAGISTCLLALALVPGTVTNRIGAHRVLRFFGRYSYGLYVWHYLASPVFSGWLAIFHRAIHSLVVAEILYLLTILALFTGISVASYELIEVRFLRLKSRFTAGRSVEAPNVP